MIQTYATFQSGEQLKQSSEYASIQVKFIGSREEVVLNANEYVFKSNKDIDAFVEHLKQFMKEKEDRQNAAFKKNFARIVT